MADLMKKPCLRCILSETDDEEMIKLISMRVDAIPEDKKASTELTDTRIHICKQCDNLISGVCSKCGCYIELRTAIADSYCPDVPKRW